MVNFKKLKDRSAVKKPVLKKKPGLNLAFLLAIVSLLFCWFYGVPALVAGIVSLRDFFGLRKGKKSGKGAAGFKMRWGYYLAWSGVVFSAVFTFYYCLALFSGAFVRI
jgi:hypothetical protein